MSGELANVALHSRGCRNPRRFAAILDRLLAAARDDDARAFFLQAFCRCQADAAVSSGDSRRFPFESFHAGLLD